MHLHMENERFARKMERKGHTWSFKTTDDAAARHADRSADQKCEDIYEWIRERYRES